MVISLWERGVNVAPHEGTAAGKLESEFVVVVKMLCTFLVNGFLLWHLQT